MNGPRGPSWRRMVRALRCGVLVCGLAGCGLDRPSAHLICHNSNCVGSNPSRDGTFEALRESITLDHDGRAIIDGIELDLMWEAAGERCAYARSFDAAATAPDALAVAAELAEHFRTRGPLAAWNGARFYLRLEFQPGAAPDGGPLSADGLDRLAGCALAFAEIVEAAAAEGGLGLTTVFASDDLQLLLALPEHPAWRPDVTGPQQARMISLPLGYTPEPLIAPFVGVGTMKWTSARDGAYATCRALEAEGIDVAIWMRDATEEALGVIEYVEPTQVITNEARFFRGWLDPP